MKSNIKLCINLVLLSCLAFFNSVVAQNPDTVKVLFIGNSFTSQNDLPALFSQLSQGAGKNVVVASHMPGGISVGDTVQGTSAHMNNPLVYSLIRSNQWDYLVLQDNQGRFCLGYGQFPASSLVIEGHLKIRDSLLFYNPCAKVIWYAGFGPKHGYPPYGNTGEALIDSIYRNYQFLLDTAGQIIAPIGPAFIRVISGYPSINLWGPDEVHPSLYGSFLVANVLYTTIFKNSPINSPYNPGISITEDTLLKNLAFQTTIDSLYHSGLIYFTPAIVRAGNTLSVSGYQNCNWYFNGSPYVTNNCTAFINQSGVYSAYVSDTNGCGYLTLEYPFLLSEISEYFNNAFNNLLLYPNPVINHSTININFSFTKSIEIDFYNCTGQLTLTRHLSPGQNKVNISGLNDGIYFVTFKSEKFFKSQRLIIKNN